MGNFLRVFYIQGFYDNKAVGKIEEDFQGTLKKCQEVTWEDYRKIPLLQKLLGRTFRLFAPMM